MNEIRPTNQGAAEVELAREIVSRHRSMFPPFVVDFDVRLGVSDGDPALFVLYKATGEDGDWLSDEWQRRADAYRRLDDAVLPALIEALDRRFPYSFIVPDRQWGTFPD